MIFQQSKDFASPYNFQKSARISYTKSSMPCGNCGLWLLWLPLTSYCGPFVCLPFWHLGLKPSEGGERRVLQISKTRTEEIKCRCFNNLCFLIFCLISPFEKVPLYPQFGICINMSNNQTCIKGFYICLLVHDEDPPIVMYIRDQSNFPKPYYVGHV